MKSKLLAIATLWVMVYSQSLNSSPNEKEIMNTNEQGCPFGYDKLKSSGKVIRNEGHTNKSWWPNQLDLSILRQNSSLSDPMGNAFNYREEFENLDYEMLKKDLAELMTNSKEWWPADFGHYGGLFIRMAWHSAGTYRTGDGRGGSRAGQQRFAPLNSWPDNANLDKARRLLWPIKQKYGKKISWADLMILTGNVALESMGFKTIGFAGGRKDVWEPESNVYWGSEKKWLADKRFDENRELEKPLAAVQMGLIYVNPEGPNGNPDPKLAAHDIRETFGRMGMNDEETVALIAGGHTLGKTHGAAGGEHLDSDPEEANIEQQGLGWKNNYKTGKGADAITSGLEVIWTSTPAKWSHDFFKSLFENEWELTKSPGGAHQFVAVNPKKMYPDAFDSTKTHKPTMLVTDISLREDPIYEKISRRFYVNPEEFETAFAKAWFKLTHRDMGPKSTYLGPEIPDEEFIWQDPIPTLNHELVSKEDIELLKDIISDSGLTSEELILTAWSAASTYRDSDRRGGANGARIRLEPQINWECNNPIQLRRVLTTYERIQSDSNNDNRQISIADLIILGGNLAVELAAKKKGIDVKIPFHPGRMDATQEQTDIESFAVLEPMADGFRNYKKKDYSLSGEQLLIDKAQLMKLTAPEMTVIYGGMRALNINYDGSKHGILTEQPGVLSNDFFKNLLSMEFEWTPQTSNRELFNGYKRGTQEIKWTATRTDLVFGSNSELRALSEVYASEDANDKFISDFVSAWTKVMMLDRFDIQK